MNSAHKEEWWSLMKKDPVVDTVGEWIRWPSGSAYFLLSIFRMSETYNDENIARYKKRAVFFFIALLMSFILILFIAVILPKM
jgi:hypothetical protein